VSSEISRSEKSRIAPSASIYPGVSEAARWIGHSDGLQALTGLSAALAPPAATRLDPESVELGAEAMAGEEDAASKTVVALA